MTTYTSITAALASIDTFIGRFVRTHPKHFGLGFDQERVVFGESGKVGSGVTIMLASPKPPVTATASAPRSWYLENPGFTIEATVDALDDPYFGLFGVEYRVAVQTPGTYLIRDYMYDDGPDFCPYFTVIEANPPWDVETGEIQEMCVVCGTAPATTYCDPCEMVTCGPCLKSHNEEGAKE